jgi:hypothetical protein
MIAFFLGLFIGAALGALGLGLCTMSRDNSECNACRAEQRRVVAGLEVLIHGLKSSNGKLASEVNGLAFRNAGFKAR